MFQQALDGSSVLPEREPEGLLVVVQLKLGGTEDGEGRLEGCPAGELYGDLVEELQWSVSIRLEESRGTYLSSETFVVVDTRDDGGHVLSELMNHLGRRLLLRCKTQSDLPCQVRTRDVPFEENAWKKEAT